MDESGRPVEKLRQDEFEVFEDGAKQEIVGSAEASFPLPAPHPPVLRDAASNAEADTARVLVLVLDDVNSDQQATERLPATARALLSRLGPDDRVGMLLGSLARGGAFEFTTHHAGLVASLEGFQARRARV